MIRGAVKGNPCCRHAPKGVGEIGTGWIQDRQMVEASGSRRGWRSTPALPGVQPDMVVIAASSDERRGRPEALRELKAQYVAIKAQRPIQVRNPEMNVANANVGMNGHAHSADAGAGARRRIRTFVMRRRSTSSTSTARSSISKVSPTYGMRPRCDSR